MNGDYRKPKILTEPQSLVRKDGTIISTIITIKNALDNNGERIVAIVAFVEIDG
jgi:hypothetical protein